MLQLITKGMPLDFTKILNELCTRKDPYEEWMSRIYDILENSKETNMSALSTGIGCSRGGDGSDRDKND